VHTRNGKGISDKINRLCCDCLGDEVRSWGCGVWGQRGVDQGNGEVTNQDVANTGTSLVGQRMEWGVGEIGRRIHSLMCHGGSVGESQQRKRRDSELGSGVLSNGNCPGEVTTRGTSTKVFRDRDRSGEDGCLLLSKREGVQDAESFPCFFFLRVSASSEFTYTFTVTIIISVFVPGLVQKLK
jgi:hypothetical protein